LRRKEDEKKNKDRGKKGQRENSGKEKDNRKNFEEGISGRKEPENFGGFLFEKENEIEDFWTQFLERKVKDATRHTVQ
jgi:hypothetical protein